MMKPVGKPDAGKLHVRFDERGGETAHAYTRHRAPPRLYQLMLLEAAAIRRSDAKSRRTNFSEWRSRPFSFLDPLLARASLVVENNDILGGCKDFVPSAFGVSVL